MESTIHLGGIGILIEPSILLILFASLMFWALCRVEDNGNGRWWLLVGAAAGLVLLSKYMALLFVPAVVVLLLATPRNRCWLLTPWPWVAAVHHRCGVLSGALVEPAERLSVAAVPIRPGSRGTPGRPPLSPRFPPALVLGLDRSDHAAAAADRGRCRGVAGIPGRATGTTLALAMAFLFFLGFLGGALADAEDHYGGRSPSRPLGIAAMVITFQRSATGLLGLAKQTGKRFLIAAVCVKPAAAVARPLARQLRPDRPGAGPT